MSALLVVPTLARAQSDTIPLNRVVPAQTPLAALAGRVPGVRMTTISGRPFAQSAIEMRSAGGRLWSPDPLLIVDGAIASATLEDLNTDDIERIELLKGPAASAVYGVLGGNGVVLIHTRRPTGSEATLSLRSEFGYNSVARTWPLSAHHAFQLNAARTDFLYDAQGRRVEEVDLVADNPFPRTFDPQGMVFPARSVLTNHLAASQRFSRLGYFASLHHDRDEGVLAIVHGAARQSGRLNVDLRPLRGLEISGGAFFGSTTNDVPDLALVTAGLTAADRGTRLDSVVTTGCPTGMATCYVPRTGNAFVFTPPNPLYVLQNVRADGRRDRRMANARATYQPLDWLRIEGQLSSDRVGDRLLRIQPLGFLSFPINSLDSTSDRERQEQARAIVTRTIGGMRSRTVLGYSHSRHDSRVFRASAIAPTIPSSDVSGGGAYALRGSYRSVTSANLETSLERGPMVLEGGVRKDGSSYLAFGRDEAFLYHRFAASYLVGSVGSWLSDSRIRLSHGTAGLWPGTDAHSLLGGVDLSSTIFPWGPPRPPFVRESELRLSGVVRRDYDVGYTVARRTVAGQPMLVTVPGPSGFGVRWMNAGRLSGYTHELTLGTQFKLGSGALLRLDLLGDRQTSTVDRITVGSPWIIVGNGIVRPGRSPNDIYGPVFIRTLAQLEEVIALGHAGATTVNDYVRNEQGYYVRAVDFHTMAEYPLVFWGCLERNGAGQCVFENQYRPVANPDPDFTIGALPRLVWRSFEATATMTWQQGGDVVNARRGERLLLGTDPATDQSDITPAGGCPDPSVNPTCAYSTGQKPLPYYRGFISSFYPSEYYVEDASFVKVRELAVNWSLPSRWTSHVHAADGARIGIVGRNLWTLTGYTGYDPEVGARGEGNTVTRGWDGARYPPYRTFSVTAQLAF